MKAIKGLKIYYSILIFIIALLLFNAYSNSKNEVTFTPKYTLENNSIKTEKGDILVFADSIKKPKYINEYVGIMKNDTIVSYRRKLNWDVEIIYMFNGDKYETYRSNIDDKNIENAKSKIQIENLDTDMMNHYAGLFWIPLIVYFIFFIVSFITSIDEREGTKYTIIYKLLYNLINYIFSVLLTWYLCNIGMWMMIIVISYVVIALIFFHSEDDLAGDLQEYGYSKHIQHRKINNLKNNYNELIK